MGGQWYDQPTSIALGVGGIVHTAGIFQDTADFDPSVGTQNLIQTNGGSVFVSKLANNGTYVWARELDGTGDRSIKDLAVDASGGVYVLGEFTDSLDADPSAGVDWLYSPFATTNMFLVKLNSAGNLLWAHSWGGGFVSGQYSYPDALDLGSGGSVHITGRFSGGIDFDPGAGNADLSSSGGSSFVLKLNTNGIFLWVREFAATDIGNIRLREVAVDANDAVVITGEFGGSVDFDPSAGVDLVAANDIDIVLIKLTASGALVWYHTLGDDDVDEGWSIDTDANGNICIIGGFSGVVDFDPGAGTVSLDHTDGSRLFLAKYDGSGNCLWAGQPGDEFAEGYNARVRFGPAQEVYIQYNWYFQLMLMHQVEQDTRGNVQRTLFIERWSAGGVLGWSRSIGPVLPPNDLAIGSAAAIFTSVGFSSPLDVDPNAAVTELTSTGNVDVLVHKMYQCLTVTINTSASACDSYTWAVNGQTYAQSGLYADTLARWCGGDSIIVLDLTVGLSTAGMQEVTTCDPYTWGANGTTYDQSGTYIATLVNEAGCDSTATLLLLIAPSYVYLQMVDTCNSYQWPVDGQTYTQGGTYTASYVTALGCDSVYVLELTITPGYVLNEDAIACDSYTWGANGQTYTQGGTYSLELTTAAGCDSILTLTLGLNYSSAGTNAVTACGSYIWGANGQTYTTSGSWTVDLLTVNGCDSTVTLDLTISNEAFGSETVTACDSYTWAANGQTYDQGGTYTTDLTSTQGCDSTAALFLTINYSASGGEFVNACDNYTWSANGQTYTESGLYTALISTVLGCDSIASLALEITNGYQATLTTTACDSYTWNANGENYTSSGSWTEAFTTASGCDSVLTLDLTVYASNAITEVVNTCDAYLWAVTGETYITSGTWTETFTTLNGCDSTRTLELTLGNSNGGTDVIGACLNYTWPANGETYVATGMYFAVLTNASGCDSIAVLDLTISDEAFSSESASICSSYTWAATGETYTESGSYSVTLPGSQGCDSTVTLLLTVNPAGVGSEQAEACSSFTWTTNGETYTASGTYIANLTTMAGCDSSVTLVLTVFPITQDTIQGSGCGSFDWQGQTLTETGTYTAEIISPDGCISTETLELTIGTPNAGSEEVTACDSYTWAANGETYTLPGTSTATLENSLGCDSAATLILSLNQASSSTVDTTACALFLWNANGETYTTSGTYFATLTNEQGCDSLLTLALDVNTLDVSITQNGDQLFVAEGDAAYQWVDCDNGNTPIPGAMGQAYTPTVLGSYAVAVTLGGCTQLSACTQVNVGVEDGSFISGIHVGPNPTDAVTVVSFGTRQEHVSVQVIDALGQVLSERKAKNTDRMAIELSLARGLYLLAVENGAGERAVVRVVVR